MAGGKGGAVKQKILEYIFRGTVAGGWTKPATFYIALFSNVPDENGGVELAGFGYARKSYANSGANWIFTAPNVMKNAASITFGFVFSGGSWQCQGFGLYDASGGGNLWYYGPLAQPITVLQGDSFVFPVGTLTITED